jgi:hypothetical protein
MFFYRYLINHLNPINNILISGNLHKISPLKTIYKKSKYIYVYKYNNNYYSKGLRTFGNTYIILLYFLTLQMRNFYKNRLSSI